MRSFVAFSSLVFALGSIPLPATAAPPEPPTVDDTARAEIVEEIADALNEVYVFPETAREMEERLQARLRDGSWDEVDDLVEFTDLLTEELRDVSRDLHLRVSWEPPLPDGAGDGPDEAARRARYEESLRRGNYCFQAIEILAGNVGYLKLDCFAPAELGGDTAVAAMNFLSGVDALIVDVRENGGGSPSMIQLLTSYLLAEPTHLNSFYVRRTDSTQQFWTQARVDGPRLVDVPVWVLISGRTFSAAEEFSYNLRNLERATLVGETTGGGAHPVDRFRLERHPVVVSLPFGRAINPITGTNWEGTGVLPHLEVPRSEALAVAHEKALERLVEDAPEGERRASIEFFRESLRLRRVSPVELDAEALREFVGSYGPRTLRADAGRLVYRRGDGPEVVLVPAGDDVFLFGDDDDFRFRFERDAKGSVARIVGLYPDGRTDVHERD